MALFAQALTALFLAAAATAQQPPGNDDINAKVARFDLETATLADVIRVFGEPLEYNWSGRKYTPDQLPATYLAVYPDLFMVLISNGAAVELRFLRPGFVFKGSLQVGSPFGDVMALVAPPTTVLDGKPNAGVPGVLYKNIDGQAGVHYYCSEPDGARMFFGQDKLVALYLFRRGPVKAVANSIKPYDDVRDKDLSLLDLAGMADVIWTLTFNQKTLWPAAVRMPEGVDPAELMKMAANPGLGVRDLHAEGITGKGVNVAIIDQPVYLDHPEFDGRVAAYTDVGCDSESSMHGPAVTSLLAGKTIGTAPEAKVYFAAAPSWTGDAAYQAKALEWVVEQNRSLGPGEKIRVVSVSAAPSGPGSPFTKNNAMWDEAVALADSEGLLVLDCTEHRGKIGACWLPGPDREDPASCRPGYPGMTPFASPGRLLAPASPRLTAEEYKKGDFGFQYTGRGGLSWTIPYASGVLALGWQVRPELTGAQMMDLLFRSAFVLADGTRVVNPKAFVKAVREYNP